ncbi:MAG: hypothetical protein E7257_05860 [Lachnospiraceae bacterium]|nr:hypothetical protein [Lachnospiraceae bacterium]
MDIIGVVIITVAIIAWGMTSVVKDKKRVENQESKDDITDWVEHIAKTTGRTNKITKAAFHTPGHEYTEYEITYEVDGVTYNKWFDLYPGVELGDVFGDDTSVLMKYSESNPDVFDVISILDDSNVMMF